MMHHPLHRPGQHFQTRRERRAALIARMMMAALLVLSLVLISAPLWAAECGSGIRLEVGIGAHDSGIDGPEYTTKNPLGIVAARYHTGPWVFSFEHTSSLEGFPAIFDSPSEYGYGANVLSLRYGWWL